MGAVLVRSTAVTGLSLGATAAALWTARCQSTQPSLTSMRLRVGTYNLLCPTYGVKWGEREACLDWRSKHEHGLSNWELRWPALLRVIQAAPWDLLALEELEDGTRADVEAACDGLGLRLVWFPHPGRCDALGLAYNPQALRAEESASRGYPTGAPRATSGRVDFRHLQTGRVVRAAVTHQRGGVAEQWNDLVDFVGDAAEEATCIICGDMNEDFGSVASGAKGSDFVSLDRDAAAGESLVSRPPHKMTSDQSSGKGKIDYVLVRPPKGGAVVFERDEASRRAMALAHGPCDETGQWPSDHDIEAVSLTVS